MATAIGHDSGPGVTRTPPHVPSVPTVVDTALNGCTKADMDNSNVRPSLRKNEN